MSYPGNLPSYSASGYISPSARSMSPAHSHALPQTHYQGQSQGQSQGQVPGYHHSRTPPSFDEYEGHSNGRSMDYPPTYGNFYNSSSQGYPQYYQGGSASQNYSNYHSKPPPAAKSGYSSVWETDELTRHSPPVMGIGRPVPPINLPFNTVPDYRKVYRNGSAMAGSGGSVPDLTRRASHAEPLQRYPSPHHSGAYHNPMVRNAMLSRRASDSLIPDSPHSPPGVIRSPLLEEFRNNKIKKYEISVLFKIFLLRFLSCKPKSNPEIGHCWLHCGVQW
jgi:hypothetical protein